MEKCTNGHEMSDENTYRNGDYTRCRACHRDRNRRSYKERKMLTLPDKIADLQADLDRLRQDYAAAPKDHRLSEAYGLAEQRYRWASTYEKREAAKVEGTAARLTAAEAYRNRPRWDNREWGNHLPDTCPSCGGLGTGGRIEDALPCSGYTVRLGDHGAQCTICRHQWKLEIS